MDLIIVESPTKARTLSKFLGGDFAVEATMGHIKDLPKSKLSVDVENNFLPDYVSVEKKADVIKKLEKEAKKAKNIFLATDPDREGEAIAKHVEEIVGKEKSQRIVFHEITKEAVEEAIASPRKIDENLVDAQTSRRVLDRLVGYNLSPLLWKKVRRGLSAGRVQSVTVRLIVEREREIEKFRPSEYWQIFVTVKSKKEFVVELLKTEVSNKKRADEVVTDLKNSGYIVLDVKKREVRKNPYPPFTTSTMTQAGARLFGWSAKRTMSVAQGLYEEGLITYHRTDSTNIAQVAISKAREFIKKEYGDSYLPGAARAYKTKSKVAQEAHEAIRPTDMNKKPDGINKLYDLIWKRFIACQMEASVYDETTINVEAQGKNKYLLRASGQIMRFDGWRKVMPLKGMEDTPKELPEVVKGESLDLIKIDSTQKFTEPPARFNEASLIKTLEKLGIGRPSTYAPIITTIQIRQYVEKKEGKFFATSVGMAVTDFLVNNFKEIVDYKFTAEMENDLDNIANGERKWQVEMKSFWDPFKKKLDSVTKDSKRVAIPTEKIGRKCPDCKDGELVIRIGRFGKFISCSNFPECKHTEKYIEKFGMKCPDCKEGEIIIKRTGRGRHFFGCSRYPDCKWASWRKPGKEKEDGEEK
ncbi:MAG: type I DNA topoisomerase [Patescibacteria group bacterium]